MLIRARAPSGLVRWQVEEDEPLVILKRKAEQEWPGENITAVAFENRKQVNILTDVSAAQTFKEAGINRGDLFYVVFAGSPSPIVNEPALATSFKESIDAPADARCFNYVVFSYLRKYIPGFQGGNPREGAAL